MGFRIDASVERDGPPRSPAGSKFIDRPTTGKGEVEVEFPNLSAPKIFSFSLFERYQCHRSVQVIEDLHGPLKIQNFANDAGSLRAKAGTRSEERRVGKGCRW